MKKIVVVGLGFNDEQKARLEAVGDVSYSDSPDSKDAWMKLVEDADVICSDGSYLYDALGDLENVMATYPFIELGSFSSQELADKGVYIANTQGSNRDSIVQWTIFMALSLFRGFPDKINATNDLEFEWSESLSDHKALIVGNGSIGSEIGSVLESLGMDVDYTKRGDDIPAMAKGKKLIVNSLNCNPTTENLLDADFFAGLDKGSFYATFSRQHTYDLDGLIAALDAGNVAGAAIDCDPEAPFTTDNDYYQKVLAHDKILATPHIAFATKQAQRNGLETVVRNVEAYVSGSPINIVVK